MAATKQRRRAAKKPPAGAVSARKNVASAARSTSAETTLIAANTVLTEENERLAAENRELRATIDRAREDTRNAQGNAADYAGELRRATRELAAAADAIEKSKKLLGAAKEIFLKAEGGKEALSDLVMRQAKASAPTAKVTAVGIDLDDLMGEGGPGISQILGMLGPDFLSDLFAHHFGESEAGSGRERHGNGGMGGGL